MIVATQVLESMTTEARPTRAEVSDAANAVDDGVDAIMLAGETAAGAFPARAVQTLDAIIRDAEESVGASSRGFAGLEMRSHDGPPRSRAGALRGGGHARRAWRRAGDRRRHARRRHRAAAVGAPAARADPRHDRPRRDRPALVAALGRDRRFRPTFPRRAKRPRQIGRSSCREGWCRRARPPCS